MTESNIRRIKNETVSLATLEQVLPTECFSAVCDSFHKEYPKNGNEVYAAYFGAPSEAPLTDEEKAELFETLGSELVKGHYSTQQLRSLIEKHPLDKRRRNE